MRFATEGRRWPGGLTVALMLGGLASLLVATVPPFSAEAKSAPEAQVRVIAGHQVSLWRPPPSRLKEPVPVVVALHGVGATGEMVARDLVEEAGRRGWLLVAPTFRYGDWRDPQQVRRDDLALTRAVADIVDALPGQTGLATRPKAMLFGFSRGSQLAHRTAFFYPERVRGAVCLSGGTYTLPSLASPDGRDSLDFPFGLGNAYWLLGRPLDWAEIEQVKFLVGVGANDNREADVPRRWDALLGKNRVERAQAFHRALTARGISSQLTIFPNADHALSPPMRDAALAFFQTLVDEEDAWGRTA